MQWELTNMRFNKDIKINNILNEEHKGFGGIYFLIINYLFAVIMSLCLQVSWQSQVVAIADNLAYIAATNTLVKSYVSNSSSYDSINPVIVTPNGTYSPKSDFNQMLNTAGLSAGQVSRCRVIYDANKHKVRIQFGGFNTILGVRCTPHEQDTVIEAY